MAAAVVGFSDGRDGKPQIAVGASPAQTNDPFAEWIDQTVSAMRRLSSYFQPEIRNKAVEVLRKSHCLDGIWSLEESDTEGLELQQFAGRLCHLLWHRSSPP